MKKTFIKILTLILALSMAFSVSAAEFDAGKHADSSVVNIKGRIDPEKIDKDSLLDFENCLNYAFDLSGELKYGYQLYQSFLKIKEGSTYQEKCKRFKDWISDAQSSTIKEFDSASQTLMKWHKEILNSFKTNYTNSSTEGKNNKIKVIKRIAFGFRNIDNLRNRIKIRDLKV